jgi:ankyrin repeat protein
VGFAPDVNQCRELCRLTWRVAQRGDTASMLERSLELQCGAKAAHTAKREDFSRPETGRVISETTQLIRAAMLNNLPRVLQLIQLGAPLDLADETIGYSALQWASCMGHEHIAKALLDGKYERRGATVDVRSKNNSTPLMDACFCGHEAVVRLLLSRGAKLKLKNDSGWTALHHAVDRNEPSFVALLCAAPGAATALSLKNFDKRTPLALAIHLHFAACEAVLRAHGATV